MVKQYTENQYDDDLTVGSDEYDDSYHTDVDDLFSFSTDEESSISRLKSLILSIDWEITDEVLMQFNEELADLRDIWAGEKLNLVYVQALEKISKYIYHKKADSHPSAIKLLLTLYHNLEKLVSSVDLSEEQKKEILLQDVKKFENLKLLIGKQSKQSQEIEEPGASVKPTAPKDEEDIVGIDELQNLKAIVLGIDWEITDEDLNDLRQEVFHLEEKYANRKPILILLQGIGAIGAYIKLKKSDAHADAFKLLHFFYESLEKIVLTPLGREEEKAILLPAVEKFNSFKTQVGTTISPESLSRKEEETDEESDAIDSDGIDGVVPAFADIPEEETRGFQAEEEAQALGLDSSGNVGSHVDTFFTDGGVVADESSNGYSTEDEEADAVEEMIGESEMFAGKTDSVATPIAKEVALQGVDVKEDEEEEPDDKLDAVGTVFSPALSIEEEDDIEPGRLFSEDKVEPKEDFDSPAKEISASDITPQASKEYEFDETGKDFSHLEKNVALQGVDVETEADEEEGEEALPMMGEEVAPALADNDEVSIYNTEHLEEALEKDFLNDEIAGNLDGFFDEKTEQQLPPLPEGDTEDKVVDVQSASVEVDEVETEMNAGPQSLDDSPTRETEDLFESEDLEEIDSISPADEESFVVDLEQSANLTEEEPEQPLFAEISDETNLVSEPEIEVEESLDEPFLSESEVEQGKEGSEDDGSQLFDSAELGVVEAGGEEDSSVDIDQQLDTFFDLEEGVEEPEEDELLSVIEENSRDDLPATQVEVSATALDVMSEDEEVVFELAEEKAAPKRDGEQISMVSGSVETDMEAEGLVNLRSCVDSLGVELDTKVILGLFQEISSLRETWSERPLEKTFLLLLSAITEHIDQTRHESSDEAYGLLQSVCTALTDLEDNNLPQNQELLQAEVTKVLEWQQGLLARHYSKKRDV